MGRRRYRFSLQQPTYYIRLHGRDWTRCFGRGTVNNMSDGNIKTGRVRRTNKTRARSLLMLVGRLRSRRGQCRQRRRQSDGRPNASHRGNGREDRRRVTTRQRLFGANRCYYTGPYTGTMVERVTSRAIRSPPQHKGRVGHRARRCGRNR